MALKPTIVMGSKVAHERGAGIVVAFSRDTPFRYDVRLLASDEVLRNETDATLQLLDHRPIDDPDVPESYRDWLRTRRTA